MHVDFENNNEIYVIAEIGMTHDGSFGLASKLTESAINSGVNVIKYQWHIADEETAVDAPSTPNLTGESRYEYFKRTEFSTSQFKKLAQQCLDSNVIPCVSVFSIESLKNAIFVVFELVISILLTFPDSDINLLGTSLLCYYIIFFLNYIFPTHKY